MIIARAESRTDQRNDQDRAVPEGAAFFAEFCDFTRQRVCPVKYQCIEFGNL